MHTYCDPNHLALPPLQCPTVLRRRLASKILSLLGFYYVSPFENCFDPITGNLETCYCDIRLMWLQDQIRTLHFDIFSKEKQCAEETDVHGFFRRYKELHKLRSPSSGISTLQNNTGCSTPAKSSFTVETYAGTFLPIMCR